MTSIFYLVPNSDRPSWGVGIIYDHVYMLIKHGFNVLIIKEKNCSVPSWLKMDVPVRDYAFLKEHLTQNDILVVPETMLNFPHLKRMKCRKLLFIQAPAYIFESMPSGEDHKTLGFQHVMIIMPHLEGIVKKHIDLPYSIIPPFVADYFFNISSKKRKRQILFYPKFHQIDYTIVKYLVERHIRNINKSWYTDLLNQANWSIKELKGFSHKEVAKIMQESSFFVSLNTFEALNTSVVESMASGCIVFCYEGFGPRDYLRNNINAKVFQNNQAYELAEAICNEIDHYEIKESSLTQMRAHAFETACNFKRSETKRKLIDFYTSFIESRE